MSTSQRNLARLARQSAFDADARRVLADLRCAPANAATPTAGPTLLQRIGRMLAAAGSASPGWSQPVWAERI